MVFSITREISIDMAHRVPTHGSKCWNIHGHRYRILATVRGELNPEGNQQDMVMDFSFLKEVMLGRIDYICDHGMVLWEQDPWLSRFKKTRRAYGKTFGFHEEERASDQTKLVVVPFIPTAEKLAEFWFNLMFEDVKRKSQGLGELTKVEVYETPYCRAQYPFLVNVES